MRKRTFNLYRAIYGKPHPDEPPPAPKSEARKELDHVQMSQLRNIADQFAMAGISAQQLADGFAALTSADITLIGLGLADAESQVAFRAYDDPAPDPAAIYRPEEVSESFLRSLNYNLQEELRAQIERFYAGGNEINRAADFAGIRTISSINVPDDSAIFVQDTPLERIRRWVNPDANIRSARPRR